MVNRNRLVIRHGEYDHRTGGLSDKGRETVEASAAELTEKLEETQRLQIHTSSSKRALETAELLAYNIEQDTEITVAGVLDPDRMADPTRIELLRYIKIAEALGRGAANDSGLLVVGHMPHVIELANLGQYADPGYGEIFPVDYPADPNDIPY